MFPLEVHRCKGKTLTLMLSQVATLERGRSGGWGGGEGWVLKDLTSSSIFDQNREDIKIMLLI